MEIKYLCFCTLLLHLTSIVRTLSNSPNTEGTNSAPSMDLSNDGQFLTLHPITDLASPGTNYSIPGTTLTLRFYLNRTPLARASMQHTLLQTQIKLRRYITTHYQATRDVLFPSDDPYTSDDRDSTGCFFAITHWPIHRQKRLTYGMVDGALKGLWEFLIRQERFVEAQFYVMDEEKGTVGYGWVSRERPRPRPEVRNSVET